MAFADLIAATDRAVQAHLGGEPVIYQPAAGASVPVTGIFDASFVFVQQSGVQAGVEAVTPAVFLQLADLPTDPKQDDPILTIGGVDYRVWERQPAGLGSIVLALRKAT